MKLPSLRLLAFHLVCGATLTVALPLVYATITFLPRPRAWIVSQRIYRAFFALFGTKVRVRGLENVDLSRPYVVMANHTSVLDHFALCVAMPVALIGVEKRENFKVPIYGPLMRRWGNIPIDRSTPKRAHESMREAGRVLSAGGVWLLVFPEGTRTRDGSLGVFKKGGFHVAADTGVQLLPVVIKGARDVSVNGVRWFLAHEITIEVLAPIDPQGEIDESLARVRSAIEARLG